MKPLPLFLVRLRPCIGDVEGNATRLLAERAKADSSVLVMTGELYLSGYPAQDLLHRKTFLRALREQIYRLVAATADGGAAILFGTPWMDAWQDESNADSMHPPDLENPFLYNVMILADKGKIVGLRKKTTLTNAGVFDEKRHFIPADESAQSPLEWREHKLAILICQDAWSAQPLKSLKAAGAECFLVANASPWDSEKSATRLSILQDRIRESNLPCVYLNLIGAQEDLIFDGEALALTAEGAPLLRLPLFQEQSAAFCLADKPVAENPPLAEVLSPQEGRYTAIVSALRDYLLPSGFDKAVLGLSGGIDSALTLGLAVDALGAEQVTAVLLPTAFTSTESREDALATARALGAKTHEISIESLRLAIAEPLAAVAPAAGAAHPDLRGSDQVLPDVAGENIQPRLRGLLLMALTNRLQGTILLATGNKSEFAVGYATLYGDMCGGYAPLKDLYKTQVYELAHWRNGHRPEGGLGPTGEIFCERLFTKPPTAELRPGQTDEDSLPPYESLDKILYLLLEEGLDPEEVIQTGVARETVAFVWRVLCASEYKRRQSPTGPRLSPMAFGREWRWHTQAQFDLDETASPATSPATSPVSVPIPATK